MKTSFIASLLVTPRRCATEAIAPSRTPSAATDLKIAGHSVSNRR